MNAVLSLGADSGSAALEEARAYLAMLETLAAGQPGKLVLTGFGEDPATRAQLVPRIAHFTAGAGAADKMLRQACQWASDRHRNVYSCGAVMRADLPAGQKGGETDIAAVLLLACDFDLKDDPRAGEWESRLPLPADAVVETSPGSFQSLYLLSEPASVDKAKPVARALTESIGCDATSQDCSHVWRVPGFSNWPNAKKIAAGRSAVPFVSRFVKPWDGHSRTNLDALRAAIKPTAEATKSVPATKALPPALPKVRRPLRVRLERKLWHLPTLGENCSEAAYAVIKAYSEHGWPADAIEAAFADHPESAAARHYSSPEQLRADIARSSGKPSSAPEWVEQLNRDFSVVNDGGRVVVFRTMQDPELKRERIERISFEDFRKMFLHERVPAGTTKDGNQTYSPMGAAWLAHPHRRQFLGGVAFAPGQQLPADMLNLWRGFSLEPSAGDWSAMRDHIRDVICSGNTDLFRYVMGWLARCVQRPGEPGEVALVFRGARGVGKGIFGHSFGRLFGQHYLYASSARQLVGNFNAHLRDAVFVFGDEAFFAGDRSHEGVLKALVTEPFITIEAKYRDTVTCRNSTHILLASNEAWVVPAGTDERRFCVLDVSDARQQDRRYFDALHKQMEGGGAAAMLSDLLAHDLSGFDVRDVPQTDALREQKLHSLRGVPAWLFDCLAREQIGLSEWDEEGLEVFKADAYGRYREHSAGQREYRPANESVWGKEIRRVLRGAVQVYRPQQKDGGRERALVFGPIEDCRREFERHIRAGKINWNTFDEGGSDVDPFA